MKNPRHRNREARISLLAPAILVLMASFAHASSTLDEHRTDGQVPSATRYRVNVQADATGRDRLAAHGFDVAGHDLRGDRVEVLTDAGGLALLRREGFALTIVEQREGARPLSGGAPGAAVPEGGLPDVQYMDPAELEVFLQQVVADHPAITRLEVLGTTHEGRTLWGLMISDNAAQDEDELAVLFSGAHHAREVMTPQVMMDKIDYLTDRYGSDPQVTALVDAHEIWCVPIVNPDGVNRVFTVDDWWRKNLRDNDGNQIINGQDGVDLNRNYEWGFGGMCSGSSGDPTSTTYRGPRQGSEPEVQAMIDLGRRIRPVFDVEYHSYGEDVFFALSCDPALFSPTLSTIAGVDQSISRVIAEDYAERIIQADGEIGFDPAPYGARTDGTGRDHQYHENGAIAFVTEINSAQEGGFHPDFATYRDITVEGQRPGWLWLLERVTGPAVGGHVIDAVTGLPMQADVTLDELALHDGRRLTSDPDTGRFHVIVVPGLYHLRAKAPGYLETTAQVEAGSSWEAVQIALQPLGSTPIAREDFEDPGSASTWTVGSVSDSASRGWWEWGTPSGTFTGSILVGDVKLGAPFFDRTPDHGHRAFVTGNRPMATFAQDDVDAGVTTLTSPPFDLQGWYGVQVSWHRWLHKEDDAADALDAEVSVDGGERWVLLESVTETTATAAAVLAWTPTEIRLDDLVPPGPDVRVRFRASDTGVDNVVEAAVDDLEIRGYSLETEGRPRQVVLSEQVGTVLDWQPVPGAPDAVYDVVRGDLAHLNDAPGGVDLGRLVCVEQDSPDTSTSGHADAEAPPAGTGWYYLVRFRLAFSVGDWGTGSDGATREGSGGCP